MDFFGHLEVAGWRFFSTCLKGMALHWFNNLQPRSIDSWSVLKGKFWTRFSSNKKGRKMTAYLITVRQWSTELLRDYRTRFRAHIAKITDLIEPMAINYLVVGIDRYRHNQLLEEFFEKEPKTLQATIKIIEYRLTLQKAFGSIQYSRSPRTRHDRSPRGSRWTERNKNRSPRDQDRRYDSRRLTSSQASSISHPFRKPRDHSSEQRQSTSYKNNRVWLEKPREEKETIKLNTDKVTILAVLKTDPTYRLSWPMNPNKPPSSRYCEYHEDTGHRKMLPANKFNWRQNQGWTSQTLCWSWEVAPKCASGLRSGHRCYLRSLFGWWSLLQLKEAIRKRGISRQK